MSTFTPLFRRLDHGIPLCNNCGRSFQIKYADPPPPFTNAILRSGTVLSDIDHNYIVNAIDEMDDCNERLEEEIQALQDLTDRLKAAQQMLEDALEIHWAYVAPIRDLPKEILSAILDMACEDEVDLTNPRCPPLVLSSVCKSWRDLMLAMPRLWTRWYTPRAAHMLLDTVRKVVPRLKLFLDRSGDLPISQTIYYEGGMKYMTGSPAAAFRNTLTRQTHRWQCLRLADTTHAVRNVKDFRSLANKQFPLLNELRGSVRQLLLGIESGAFRELPSLRTLYLSNNEREVSIPDLPWEQLDMVSISATTVAYALKILGRCTNIRLWRFSTGLHQPDPDPIPPVTVVHPSLPDLRIHMDRQYNDNPLMYITAPALQSLALSWNYDEPTTDIEDPLPSLLARSRCPLRQLLLQSPLHVNKTCIASMSDLVHFRWDATRHLPVKNDFVVDVLAGHMLPRLEKLELCGALALTGDVLVHMVESRKAAERPLQLFALDIASVDPQVFGPYEEVVDKLRTLVPHFILMGEDYIKRR
ncbi:hypothetical protein BD626DRAFT_489938 [Schizophyllum amplum]|uniref:GATA-type domain-containing protein n=1 Tax=Schizophyllum amplum TaxID=97359 RepID=A0A550CJ77_9AGAR|nr:hypothetical protein BD626DRAFT_489938 [Auriculariopsis ampla]